MTARKDYLNIRTLPAKAMGSGLTSGPKPVKYLQHTVNKYTIIFLRFHGKERKLKLQLYTSLL